MKSVKLFLILIGILHAAGCERQPNAKVVAPAEQPPIVVEQRPEYVEPTDAPPSRKPTGVKIDCSEAHHQAAAKLEGVAIELKLVRHTSTPGDFSKEVLLERLTADLSSILSYAGLTKIPPSPQAASFELQIESAVWSEKYFDAGKLPTGGVCNCVAVFRLPGLPPLTRTIRREVRCPTQATRGDYPEAYGGLSREATQAAVLSLLFQADSDRVYHILDSAQKEFLAQGRNPKQWSEKLWKLRSSPFELVPAALRELGVAGEEIIWTLLKDDSGYAKSAAIAHFRARKTWAPPGGGAYSFDPSFPKDRYAAALIPLLKDRFVEVRREAAEDLCGMPESARAAVPALAEAAVDDMSGIGMLACNALSSIGVESKSALPKIIRLLERKETTQPKSWVWVGSQWWDRQKALFRFIGKLGPEASEAVPVLVSLLQLPEYPFRCEVLQTLGAIGPGAKAAIPVIEPLGRDPSETVRKCANDALAKIAAK